MAEPDLYMKIAGGRGIGRTLCEGRDFRVKGVWNA